MDLDPSRLEEVAQTLRRLYGDVGDLPAELVNTLANIYWKAADRVGGDKKSPAHVMRPLLDALASGTDIERAFSDATRKQTHLLNCLKQGPSLVKSMRAVREEKPDLFPYLCEMTLDLLKYDIEDAINKSEEQRRLERASRHIEEVPNLAVLMGLIREPAPSEPEPHAIDWMAAMPTAPDITQAKPTNLFQIHGYSASKASPVEVATPMTARSGPAPVDSGSQNPRKWLAIAYLGAMLLATLIVPWKIDVRNDRYATDISQGYSVIWKNPKSVATVDYGKVALEYVAISCGFGIAWLVLARRQ